MKKANEKFCNSCGDLINITVRECPRCGAQQVPPVPPRMNPQTQYQAYVPDPNVSDKDWMITLLLAIFVGGFGVHRFYTGNILTGILMLITLGACGVWTLIDIIIIATGSFKDGDGRVVKQSV